MGFGVWGLGFWGFGFGAMPNPQTCLQERTAEACDAAVRGGSQAWPTLVVLQGRCS